MNYPLKSFKMVIFDAFVTLWSLDWLLQEKDLLH